MDIIRFVLIGLGAGALYALVAQGLVLVYRGSGVLNFAQGAFVMVGAYVYYAVSVQRGLPLVVGLIAATAAGVLVGALVYLVILRNMRHSSGLLRVVATLAVLMVLQAAAVLIFGVDILSVPSLLPTEPIELIAGAPVGMDRVILFVIGLVSTAALWAVYRYTTFGRATSAVAENQRAAASLGHSPDRIGTVNWAIGSGLAALAGAFIAPITFLQPTQLSLLVIPALAIGLVANFTSFPLVFAAGLGLGIVESLMARYVTTPGLSQSVPFVVVIMMLIVRGRGLPLRSHVLDRLPAVGSGRIRPIPVLVTFAALTLVLTQLLSTRWVDAFTVSMGFAVLCLSVVLIVGYAGQLSLAQYVLAGIGAFIAARLAASLGWGFPLAAVAAIVLTMIVGLLVALPALRTRGINLAIATLGLAVVLYNVVLNNFEYSGGTSGIKVPSISLFGLDLNAIRHPERYAIFAAVMLFAVAVALLNVRRGATGRRMLAVRSNERAAAALGISVFGVKLFAFAAAAGIAALAGIMLAFRSSSVISAQFATFPSITAVAMTVVGGVGLVGGGIMGSTLLPGGIGSKVLSGIEGLDTWLPLISGLILLWILVTEPSGLWQMNAHLGHRVASLVRRTLPGRTGQAGQDAAGKGAARETEAESVAEAGLDIERVPERGLRVDGLRVVFGGVVAVADANFEVRPGRVHGLIGPNGAGKTTVIDAVTGFVAATGGSVRLGETDITGWSARQIAEAGLGRSFQSVELFDDLTIRENLAVACDRWTPWRYVTDFLRPGRIRLTGPALAAAHEFDLHNELDLKPAELSMGRRRVAAIARAVAASPSVLMLDEPAAGLSDAEAEHLATLIRRLAADWGMGVVLVEHNIDMVLAACDEVTVLTAGSVLVSGRPDEVRNDPRVLEAYLGASAEDESDELTGSAIVRDAVG
ncbi:ABC transporter permease subunit [Streptosporangium sp. CA-115845]|uniref:ABC transporter permease subunit n=1 Tax=Streptosporangium sp. CA-115845 TaxID=3240071 RepID=UPI003D9481E6